MAAFGRRPEKLAQFEPYRFWPERDEPDPCPCVGSQGQTEMVGAQLNRREWSRASASPTVCLVSRAKLIAEPATSAEGRRLAIPNMRIDPANSS